MQETFGRLDGQAVDAVEQTAIDSLERCNVDQNETTIKSARKGALSGLFIFTMENSSGTRKSSEDAVIQAAASPRSPATIAAAMVKNAAVMAPIAKFATETVRKEIDETVMKEIDESAKDLVLRSLSLPLSGLNSSSDESQESQK